METKRIVGLAAGLMVMMTMSVMAAPATTNVQLDSRYYEYIEKLDGMGYIQSMPTGAKPYSRLDMAKWTLEAQKVAETKPMPAYLQSYLMELKKGLSGEIAYLTGTGKLDHIKLREMNATLGYMGDDQTKYAYRNNIAGGWQPLNHQNNGYRYGDGMNIVWNAEISGNVSDNLAIALTPRFSYDKDQNSKFSLTEGYVKAKLGVVGIEVGKQPISWGQGESGSLVLGNNMNPMTMVKANFLEMQDHHGFFKFLGKTNFNVFYARLDGNRSEIAEANNRQDYDHPGLLGFRTDLVPQRNLTIGLTRISMLGGDGNGLTGSDWGHWLVGRNDSGSSDRWDDIAGIDFRYRFPGVQVYGELYGEDQAGYLPSDTAERVGFYFPQLTKDGSWDLTVEYARTQAGWYTHGRYQNGWVYDGNIMGDWMGSDARKFYAAVQHHFGQLQTLSFKGMRTEMERDVANAPTVNEFWISYSKQLEENLALTANVGLSYIENAGYIDSNTDKTYFGSLNLSWKY